jgi:hypothetical protein
MLLGKRGSNNAGATLDCYVVLYRIGCFLPFILYGAVVRSIWYSSTVIILESLFPRSFLVLSGRCFPAYGEVPSWLARCAPPDERQETEVLQGLSFGCAQSITDICNSEPRNAGKNSSVSQVIWRVLETVPCWAWDTPYRPSGTEGAMLSAIAFHSASVLTA